MINLPPVTYNLCTQSWEALYFALHAHSMEKLRPFMGRTSKECQMGLFDTIP